MGVKSRVRHHRGASPKGRARARARARKPRRGQAEFEFRSWGGRRAGAGRKPKGARAGVAHRVRRGLRRRTPVHVTLRLVEAAAKLRRRKVFQHVRAALEKGAVRDGFGVVHFTVMGNHIHLIAEADTAKALSRGMQGLSIRLSRAINRVLERKGTVFADRYHAEYLETPTQTRRALQYVLNDYRRHVAKARADKARGSVKRRKAAGVGQVGVRIAPRWADPLSTAPFFGGWARPPDVGRIGGLDPAPELAAAQTWLLRGGWKRGGGLLELCSVPG